MATNVLELRRFDHNGGQSDPLDEVTIRKKADIGAAACALDRHSRAHGLRVMLWHDLASIEEMFDAQGALLNRDILGWDEEDLEQFLDVHKAVRSPLLRACRVESEPFLINPRGIRSRWPNPYLNLIDLEDVELMPSVQSAIVVPIHLPFGQIGAAIFSSADTTRLELSRQFSGTADHLGALVRRFMAGYVKINRDPRYLPTENTLTVRQIECLRWAALGKTDYEIGIILGCSHAGVRYHISRACERLGATNRTQSVFRACQLGYLGQGG